MENNIVVIKAEKSISEVGKVIELVEGTQYDIFDNKFQYGESISLKHKAPVKDNGKLKVVDINRQLGLMLKDKTSFRNLTPFDKAVHNAICSLCYSGIETFTTDQVYKILVGNPEARLTEKIKNTIEESINTLRNRIVGIIFEEENKYYGIYLLTENGDEITEVSNYILPLAHAKLKLKNGQRVEAWSLLSEPPLLSYARIKKQIETIAIEQLQIPLPLTENTIKLREFLLRKILLIKRKTLKSGRFRKNFENCNILKYEDIFELFGFDKMDHSNKSNVQKKRLLEKCEIMFNYWMQKTGMLAKWKYYKDTSGKIIGYKLKVNLDKFTLKVEDIWNDEWFESNLLDNDESKELRNEKAKRDD